MILDCNECPANTEEIAEAYIMGLLTEKRATAFEDHYVGCNRCATVLQEAAEYMGAMRGAAKKALTEPEKK